MAWNTRINLHLDVEAAYGRVLLDPAANGTLLNATPDIISGDKAVVRLHFWQRTNTPGLLDPADPGDTATIRFSARPAGVPPDSPLLFLATAFSEIEPGIWEAEADFHTAELAAHLAEAPVGAKRILGECEVRVGTLIRSLQFDLVARPEVYENQDAPSSLPSPNDWLSARAVRYDIAQALDSEERQQLKNNIGIGETGSLGVAAIYSDSGSIAELQSEWVSAQRLILNEIPYSSLNASFYGTLSLVTDLDNPTIGAIAAGGGSTKGIVCANGTNWIVIAIL